MNELIEKIEHFNNMVLLLWCVSFAFYGIGHGQIVSILNKIKDDGVKVKK